MYHNNMSPNRDPCGPTEAVCSKPVYPTFLTAALRNQMKDVHLTETSKIEDATSALRLPETMVNNIRNLKDAAMVELSIDDRSVKEVDVVRGREMIRFKSGTYGSICLVVRRPG